MIPPWARCPRCRGHLDARGDTLACASCASRFPIVAGLPDLRIAPDLWLDADEDRRKGMRVLAEAPPGFEPALRHYWSLDPSTPPRLVARFVAHTLAAEARVGEWLATLAPPVERGERWLDVGCGTGGLLCAAPAGVATAGLDVAFRWLLVAERRLAERRVAAPLLGGNAESLPVADASFDRIFFEGTLELCPDLPAVLGEARRALRPAGCLHVRTVNRYTLLREPHVDLWGAGLVPRRYADRYVRWRGGPGYTHHWPRSARELERALAAAGFRAVRVEPGHLLASERRRLPRALLALAGLYGPLRRLAPLRRALRVIAPLLEATATAP